MMTQRYRNNSNKMIRINRNDNRIFFVVEFAILSSFFEEMEKEENGETKIDIKFAHKYHKNAISDPKSFWEKDYQNGKCQSIHDNRQSHFRFTIISNKRTCSKIYQQQNKHQYS